MKVDAVIYFQSLTWKHEAIGLTKIATDKTKVWANSRERSMILIADRSSGSVW